MSDEVVSQSQPKSKRRARDYVRKVMYSEDGNTRYDLKVMDYGICEKFVLKKYEKTAEGKWSGSCGSRVVVETYRDEEVSEMINFLQKNIMAVRQEMLENRPENQKEQV